MLRRFRLHRPETLAEVCELRCRWGEDAAIYAGGTEILLAMKMGVAHWPHLIDVKRVSGLSLIERRDGSLRIGAGATHMAVERHPAVRSALPALARLAGRIANVRVRAAGTLAGNLCFAEPHADPPALLVALGAGVELRGPGGSRRLALADFQRGAYETALGQDEVLTAIEVPLPGSGVRAAYVNFKVLERPSAGAAVVGRVEGGRFAATPAVVVGAADEVPRRVNAAMLEGASADDEAALAALAEAAADAVDPVDDLSGSAEYKRHLAGVLARRAATTVLAEAA